MTNPQKIRFDHRVSGFPLLFESAIRNPRCICVRKPWKSLRISKSPYASQNLENCFPKEALLFKFVHSMERHDAIKVNTLRSLLGQWVCRKMNLIGRVRGKKTTAVSLSHHVYVCHTCKHDRRSPTPNVSDLTKEAKSNMDKQSLMISDEKSVEGRKHQKKTEKNICFGKKMITTIHPSDHNHPHVWSSTVPLASKLSDEPSNIAAKKVPLFGGLKEEKQQPRLQLPKTVAPAESTSRPFSRDFFAPKKWPSTSEKKW